MTEWIISSTVLMLIIIGLRTALKGRISLRLQYALWLLVLVRLLVPVNFTESALSIQNAAKTAAETPPVQAITGIADFRPDVQSFDEAYAEVVARYEAGGVDVDSLSGSDLEALDYEAYEQMKAERSIGDMMADALLTVWLAGMTVTALCLLGANLRFGLRLRRSRRALPVPGCPLPVYVTAAADTPCLFGLVKPAVYLTPDVPGDENAMEHILTHERTHYRHGDHIWSVLRCVCMALHWYNPLVWVCAGLSRRDGELACDEASIRTLGEDRRGEYGRTLIDMTCQKSHGMVGLTATTMVYHQKSLRERIQLIARHPKTAAYTLVLVLLAAILTVGCTFTGVPETDGYPEEPTMAQPTLPEELAPTAQNTEPPTQPPTQPPDEQLMFYQHLLSWRSGADYYRAAGSIFRSPAELNLYYFFYNGVEVPADWEEMDAYERDILLEQGFSEHLDVQKMPWDRLEEKLRQYFGVGLEAVRIPAAWASDPETMTWYSNHSDAWLPHVTVTHYKQMDDGTVLLYLIVDAVADSEDTIVLNAATVMTLRPMEDGTYQIVSNVFAEDPA